MTQDLPPNSAVEQPAPLMQRGNTDFSNPLLFAFQPLSFAKPSTQRSPNRLQ